MADSSVDNEISRPDRLLGYGLVSIDGREGDDEMQRLRSAGCDRIFHDVDTHQAQRPVLMRLLGQLTTGDILVVVTLDRVARSIGHLIDLIEHLQKRGVHLRSLEDHLDTSAPETEISLRAFRTVVRLQTALQSQRSKAGIKAAKAHGKIPGNPGLRERRPEAIEAVSKARDKRYLDELVASSDTWLPVVQDLRPQHSWDNIVLVLNRRGQNWTVERLRRAVHRMVRQGLASPDIVTRSPRRPPSDHPMKIVAAIAIAHPGLSLRDVAAKLDEMGERPSRGGRKWQASSVRHLLDDAYRLGLIPR